MGTNGFYYPGKQESYLVAKDPTEIIPLTPH